MFQNIETIPVIREIILKWKNLENHPSFPVLRLALLRELVHTAHAERSRQMTRGEHQIAQGLEKIETALNHALESNLDPALILNFLSTPKTQILPNKSGSPPPTLSAVIKEKLNRFDRKWEKAICQQADQEHWVLWRLYAAVEMTLADRFHEGLSRCLWPDGVILFVEADARSPQSISPYWNGQWVCTFQTNIDEVRLSKFKVDQLPGCLKGKQPAWEKIST